MRENGYYWVKFFCEGAFEPAFNNGEYWLVLGNGEHYDECVFHEINPNRILTPDEKASNES